MTVIIPKATPGEHFDHLDMLTRLLTQPRKTPATNSGIEVLAEPQRMAYMAYVVVVVVVVVVLVLLVVVILTTIIRMQ